MGKSFLHYIFLSWRLEVKEEEKREGESEVREEEKEDGEEEGEEEDEEVEEEDEEEEEEEKAVVLCFRFGLTYYSLLATRKSIYIFAFWKSVIFHK